MGLIDFGKPGIDDLLVQLLLFFESEGFGCAFGQNTDNRVKHHIVKIRVVDTNRLNLSTKRLAEPDCCFQSAKGLRAAINPDKDMPLLFVHIFYISDYKGIGFNTPHNPFNDPAEQAVLNRPHTESTHNHKVIIARLNVLC